MPPYAADSRPLPPLAPGLPLLGNALSMRGDVQAFFVRQYRALGPIYRVRALNQAFVIMAGTEANRFLRTRGDDHFSTADTMGGLDDQFGMRVHALAGRPHRHLRGRLGLGLSRELLRARWDAFAELTERRVTGWRAGSTVPVVDQCQRLAADQLSVVLTGTPATAQFELLRRAFELVLDVTVTGKLPPAALRLPTYRAARRRILAFAQAAVDDRAAHPHDGPPDLLDQAVAAADEHGRPYPPRVRAGMALQGYFGGINTVAYLYGFMLYAVLRHPHVHAEVLAEVDRAGGPPSFDTLRRMPALHGLVLETLRSYPSAPASARTVVRPFDFGGFVVPRGSRVLVATTVPHHLSEHWTDPEGFRLDRDFAGMRRRDAYAPFSVGAHTCLGAGLTEVLAAATMAILLRHVRLALPAPDHRLRPRATPGPNPGRLRVRVLGPATI
ncbi:cytochrome P450 [Plantactinospora siamensis]|uniref:Cytochrome P450 n=1 Tax=Plantactinospora siamensis TaxID=555372 RepID=A0ABV6P4J4_9ACTN